jgi:hypothetical protein
MANKGADEYLWVNGQMDAWLDMRTLVASSVTSLYSLGRHQTSCYWKHANIGWIFTFPESPISLSTQLYFLFFLAVLGFELMLARQELLPLEPLHQPFLVCVCWVFSR